MNQELLKLVTKAFENDKRPDGEPYLNHLLRVEKAAVELALQINTFKLIYKYQLDLHWISNVAIAHDLFEEHGDQYDAISLQRIGITEIEIQNILILTKPMDRPYVEYIKDIKPFAYARIVKMADLKDNMRDLISGKFNHKERLEKYRFALDYLEFK